MRPAVILRSGATKNLGPSVRASRSFAALRMTPWALSLLFPALLFGQTGTLVPSSSGVPDASVLSLETMKIDIGIARGYARVNILQIFQNHTGNIQEGTWRFALPASGAVSDFAVWDANVRIPGVILEKRRARAIYRALTEQRIDPGLLQQGEEEDRAPGASPSSTERPSGGALFSVRVAPIPAHGTKRLEMAYSQEVPRADGVSELRLALKNESGAPTVARHFSVRVRAESGALQPAPAAGFQLLAKGNAAQFTGENVKLDRDVLVALRHSGEPVLRLSAFRRPGGGTGEAPALAPWERASEIPPEKDGYFLLELALASSSSKRSDAASVSGPGSPPAPARRGAELAILFDTSLSTRFGALESGYAILTRVLEGLSQTDRVLFATFDRRPAFEPGGLRPATGAGKEDLRRFLLSRALSPGSDVPGAVSAAESKLSREGRILLITDGVPAPAKWKKPPGGPQLYTVLTGDEAPASVKSASAAWLHLSTASDADRAIFLKSLLSGADPSTPAPAEPPSERARPAEKPLPFQVDGGQIRDVYAVMTQPPSPGSLSGWIGRYGEPRQSVRLEMSRAILAPPENVLAASLPEKALEARDLPRRWAKARVDFLLQKIEEEGETREAVEEIIALSKRYKFVTPYTAFLAAPRSLLRPRVIQPGDPVLRVEADAGIVSAVALFPFGLRLSLVRRPRSNLWEGRFLAPETLADGKYTLRICLTDRSGAIVSEKKTFIIDGTPPRILPRLPEKLPAGRSVEIAARADSDVVFLFARLGEGAPVALTWNPEKRLATAQLDVPRGLSGPTEVFFEATDRAKNRGFARVPVVVTPGGTVTQ